MDQPERTTPTSCDSVDGEHVLIAMKNYSFPKSFEPEEGVTIYKLKKK
jgi:hypothetical protein